MINTNIGVNEFVRRQFKGSGKTYSTTLSFEEIAKHAENQYAKGFFKQGYRDGTIIVQVSDKYLHHFICPFVIIEESTNLVAQVVKRRSDEEPYIQVRATNGKPLETVKVDLILYRHDVLAENNEQTTNAGWELISFHAIPEGIEDLPMGPVTMMRNQLELTGGTKAYYESKEWAESVKFWQKYAMMDVE